MPRDAARKQNVKVNEFDYELPAKLIAQRPLEERDASRMLIMSRAAGTFEDGRFTEFERLLRGDELIVLNNARVIPARLWGRRKGLNAQPIGKNNRIRAENLSSPIEVLLLRAVGSDEWDALVRPGRKISVDETIVFGNGELQATVVGRGNYGQRRLKFSGLGDFRESIERLGHIPLPPYIKRNDELLDRERYQTVFARQGTAVAAPTAGLHFTPAILSRLAKRGVEIREITLDVGLGTFEPVRTERLEDHEIHKESYEITEATAAAIARASREGRPVLAVGTTVVRALEDSAEKAASVATGNKKATVAAGRSEATIFLFPGKSFRVVTQLLTNFHLPQSSLLALVAAFAGKDNVLRAYRHAVEEKYRFYSYGDCMWIR